MKQRKTKTMGDVSERPSDNFPSTVSKSYRSFSKLSGLQKCVSLPVCLSVKVNDVSLGLTAIATSVPIDPTHNQQCCSPYGTIEGVCV